MKIHEPIISSLRLSNSFRDLFSNAWINVISLRRTALLCLLMACSTLTATAQVQVVMLDPRCGNLSENTFGRPIDYFTATTEFKHIVENPHFPPHVEQLQRGNTSERPGHDIAYTLRTFPNHPRALMAMIKLGQKERTEKPIGSPFTVNCWIQRALYFKPDDGNIRLVFAVELMRQQKYKEAILELKKAEDILGDNGNVLYNLGLSYFETGDYDQSLNYAHRAYARGFTFEGLRKKLGSRGKWRDPPNATQPIPTSADKSVTENPPEN